MALNRDAALRKAEKLLRQGRLDAAIAEYRQIIDDQPGDWNTANILGDLYARAGQLDKAVSEYTRIADHLAAEGFYPKAAALYKKLLKIKGNNEHALLQLAEIGARQGLLADARHALNIVADARTARGDRSGAAEVRMRLGALDPGDLEARLAGARAAAEFGDTPRAVTGLTSLARELQERGSADEALTVLAEAMRIAPGDPDVTSSVMQAYLAKGDFVRARDCARTPAQFKQIAAGLEAGGHAAEAIETLAEAAALDPTDVDTRRQLIRGYLAQGDAERARQFLSPEVAAHDVDLRWMLAELDLRGGRFEEGIALLAEVSRTHPDRRDRLVLLGCSVADISADAAHRIIELSASAAVEQGDWADAAAAFNEFVNRVPNHIPALMRLVEICVDGGLEATMYSAQGQLADAYLTAGQGAEARVIAEDLVAREPWDRVNLDRFRRALTMLGEADVDQIIADRLSGQSPFTTKDLFPAFEEDLAPPAVASAPPAEPEPLRSTVSPEVVVSPKPSATGETAATSVPEADPPEAAPTASDSSGGDVFELGAAAIDIGFLSDASIEEAGDLHAEPGEVDLSTMIEEMQPGKAGSKPDARPPEAGEPGAGFKDFREAVSRENFTEAATQHHKLATAYLDMGMIDDAMKALEIAARAPRLRFEAAGTLARLCLKRDAPGQAIEWFERAAEAPAPNPEAGRALLYELADTLESQGETSRALAVFLELQADVGEYRDLPARLDRLTRVQARG